MSGPLRSLIVIMAFALGALGLSGCCCDLTVYLPVSDVDLPSAQADTGDLDGRNTTREDALLERAGARRTHLRAAARMKH